ncbi:very short patch repair endonuclease [Massilia sp. CCM 9210]|uniref:very short patch repair endonuclease n=1 Tax=Massilia scottii TaxID=3057166 RepID=UPI002796D952|nr:very short patch repair endonuclease [Massilia sp. CCM 9210]MDQ1817322.1 very short patch repair endonuclease [Massilia sp. CCM 9210]
MTKFDNIRSQIMRAVHSKDTRPELIIRKTLHALGYRYQIHCNNLPGSPDIVFSKRRKVIFVHGCFWHGHNCKRGIRKPKANAEYWEAKIAKNQIRDTRSMDELKSAGWETSVVWECELKVRNRAELETRLTAFLGATKYMRKK